MPIETVAETAPRRQGGWPTHRRAVVDPRGDWHASIHAAARAWGTVASNVYVGIQNGRPGWRFATDADRPASGG